MVVTHHVGAGNGTPSMQSVSCLSSLCLYFKMQTISYLTKESHRIGENSTIKKCVFCTRYSITSIASFPVPAILYFTLPWGVCVCDLPLPSDL